MSVSIKAALGSGWRLRLKSPRWIPSVCLFPGRLQTQPAPRFTKNAAETFGGVLVFWGGRGGVLGRDGVRGEVSARRWAITRRSRGRGRFGAESGPSLSSEPRPLARG